MAEASVYPDWSGLPEDLMALVMRDLDIPDLFHAGAVCSTWYAAYSAVRRVRIPITDSSPCLLYSSAADDPDTATVYSPSAGAAFKVLLPAPPFRSRHVVGAGHGWVVTADEASNLQALNPLTGAQVDLPPATGLHHVEAGGSDEDGRPVYNLHDAAYPTSPAVYGARELRLYLYCLVCLSRSPSAGHGCVALLLNNPMGEMSYARVGDGRWTLITENDTGVPWRIGYTSAAYNDKDGLFYVLTHERSIYALDLNGPSPAARKITQRLKLLEDPYSCIVFAPWGDTLHVCRYTSTRTLSVPVHVPPQHAEDVINPCLESYTDGMELYKVDTDGGRDVKLSSLGLQEHALFLGFNSGTLLSTKDFPRLKPNCAYLADDNWEQICTNMYGCRDTGIWNFETETLESLVDLHSVAPWLNWPPPVWITPSLS